VGAQLTLHEAAEVTERAGHPDGQGYYQEHRDSAGKAYSSGHVASLLEGAAGAVPMGHGTVGHEDGHELTIW
jgi:hypothetical protein